MEIKMFATTQKEFEKNGSNAKGLDLVLPMDTEELEETLAKFANVDVDNIHDFDNWEIGGFEHDFIADITECTDIFAINDMAQQIEDLSSYDEEKLASIMEGTGCNSIYDVLEYLGKLDDITFYPNMNLHDVACEIVETCYNLPEIAKRYFDYEAFARDLRHDGYIETEWGVIYE